MRLYELLQRAAGELQATGIEEFVLEARLLLQSCLGKTRTEIFLLGGEEVRREDELRYLACIDRRKQREPLAYIVGEQEFWSMPFFVSPDVLIPRPETEFLLDRVLSLVSQDNLTRGPLLDLCCGSGVIATVLAKETGKMIIASDLSFPALSVAQKNLQRHGQDTQVSLVMADLFSPFWPNRTFSLVVSNPPYVGQYDLDHSLEPEVAVFEPRLALDGGSGGMEVIVEIRRRIVKYLCPGGQLFMEIGADQGEATLALFNGMSKSTPDFTRAEILVDYAGRDRVLHAVMAE
jgi:release factor glutamine methyltransferase